MNASQRHSVLEIVEKLDKINVLGVVGAMYSEPADSIMVDEISMPDFIHLLHSFVSDIGHALKDGDGWKNMSYYSSKGKSVNLEGILQDILENLVSRQSFESWIHDLRWLNEYGVHNGLWSDAGVLAEKKPDTGLLIRDLQEGVREVNRLKKQLAEARNEIVRINARQSAEFDTFKKNEAAADEAIKQIRSAEMDSANVVGKLNTTYEQMLHNNEQLQFSLEDARKHIADLHRQATESEVQRKNDEDKITIIHRQFFELLVSSKEKESEILSQKDAIAELRGFAADGALGGVFDRRSKQLGTTVTWWAIACVVVSGLAAAWILAIVRDYPVHDLGSGINWGGLLTNAIRSSPALIIVYFCLAQYTKERNVQEEYAFKAAVSMTITAYAAMVGADEERTKMLIATVQGVYTPPTLGKSIKPFSFRTKDIAEMSKNLMEATKNAQVIASDALKSKKSSDDEKKEK